MKPIDKENKLWVLLITWIAIRNAFWAGIALIGAISALKMAGMI